MPDKAKVIKIIVTDGVKGQPITVRNRNNGDEIHTTLGDTAKASIEPNNFTNGYTAGHVYDFIVNGEQIGSVSLTTSGDIPQTVTITTAAVLAGLTRGVR